MPIARASSKTQWPPVLTRDNETDEEKVQRLRNEAEAKRVSDKIDHQLDLERQQRSETAVGPKAMLLGTCYISPITLRVLYLHVWVVHGHLYYHRTGGIGKIHDFEELPTLFGTQGLRT